MTSNTCWVYIECETKELISNNQRSTKIQRLKNHEEHESIVINEMQKETLFHKNILIEICNYKKGLLQSGLAATASA